MVALDTLSLGFPLVVEGLPEDIGPDVPVYVLFGVTIAFTLLAGTLLLGYSSSFARSTASQIHNDPALSLWYGLVAWVAVFVATIVLGFLFPPAAFLLQFGAEMVGYAVAAVALGLFVLRGPLEDERADDDVDEDENVEALPNRGFDGLLEGEASPWLALVVGTVPIASLVIVPVVGWVLTFLISGFGIGALTAQYLEYEEPVPAPAEG